MVTTVILLTEGEPQLVGSEQVKHTPGQWNRLHYKYSHVGCPAARMEDNCAHPDQCADNGRCLDLGPNPFDRLPEEAGMADMLSALTAIRDGLADTKSTPGQRMTLITKADAYEIARAAIAKAEGRTP